MIRTKRPARRSFVRAAAGLGTVAAVLSGTALGAAAASAAPAVPAAPASVSIVAARQAPAGSIGSLLRKLLDPDPAGPSTLDDHFGYAVAVSGGTAVVGALDSNANSGAGAAYIYVKGAAGWPKHPTVALADPAAAAGDAFGKSVAISGGTVVVGAPGTTSGAGAAYVYVKGASGWPKAPATTLTDPGHTASDNFGRSVAVSGTSAVVGAPGSQTLRGSAYIYTKGTSGWPAAPAATLADPAAAVGDVFGTSVAVSGSTAVVGAYGTSGAAGAAYVYVKGASGWPTAPATTLADPAATTDDAFGEAVAVSGSTTVVGAPTIASVGAAYIYTKGTSGWPSKPATTLHDHVNGAADFGAAVAVAGKTAVVGAEGTFGTTASGGAFFYLKGSSGWPSKAAKAVQLTPASGSVNFGWSVAVSGATALVSAIGANNGAGVSYIYQA